MSKIETDALDAQIAAATIAATELASSSASIGGGTTASLSSYRLGNITQARVAGLKLVEDRVGNGSTSLRQTQCCQFYYISSGKHKDAAHVTHGDTSSAHILEPIGPVMHAVSAVSWAVDTSHCAVLLDHRVNILAVHQQPSMSTSASTSVSGGSTSSTSSSSSGSKTRPRVMEVIASLELESLHMSCFNSMYWNSGILFVVSPLSIHAVSVSDANIRHSATTSTNSVEVFTVATSRQVCV